jgi:hypothetical protein
VGLEEIKHGATLAGDGGLAALDAEALPLLLVDENWALQDLQRRRSVSWQAPLRWIGSEGGLRTSADFRAFVPPGSARYDMYHAWVACVHVGHG